MKLEEILTKALNEAKQAAEQCEGCDECDCDEGEITFDGHVAAELEDSDKNAETTEEMLMHLAALLMSVAKHHDMQKTAQAAFDIWVHCKE